MRVKPRVGSSPTPFVGSYLQRAELDDTAQADLRVMAFNVLTSNASHAAVLDEVERLSPDVVAVIEVDSTWIKALQPLKDRYPHRIELPRSDNFGIACWAAVSPSGQSVTSGCLGFRSSMPMSKSPVKSRFALWLCIPYRQ